MPVQFQSYSPPSTQRPIVLPPQPSIAQSVGEILAAIGNMPAQMDAARLRQMQMQQQANQIQLQNQIATMPATIQQPSQVTDVTAPSVMGGTLEEGQAPITGDILGGGVREIPSGIEPGQRVLNPDLLNTMTRLQVLQGKSPSEIQLLLQQMKGQTAQTVQGMKGETATTVQSMRGDVTRDVTRTKEEGATERTKLKIESNEKIAADINKIREEGLDIKRTTVANAASLAKSKADDLYRLHTAQIENYQDQIKKRMDKTKVGSTTEDLNKIRLLSQMASQQRLMQSAAKSGKAAEYRSAADLFNNTATWFNQQLDEGEKPIELVDPERETGVIEKLWSMATSTVSGATAAPTPPPAKTPSTTPAPKTTPPKEPTKSLDSILFGQ